MEPASIGAIAAAIVAAVAGALKVIRGQRPDDTTPAVSSESVLLDRIEELTRQLDHERERADSLESELGKLTAERDSLADRVTRLEGQLDLVLSLLHQG